MGPYIKYGKQNVKIPKDKEAADLSYEECMELVQNQPAKKAGGRFAKTKKLAELVSPSAGAFSLTTKLKLF